MDDTVTRRELLGRGWTVRDIAREVHTGRLIRVRRGHYGLPTTPQDVQRAVRVGGQVTCVSELRRLGVWVREPQSLHVHVAPNAARLRNPDDRSVRHSPDDAVILHWAPLLDRPSPSHTSILDALVASLQCLDRRDAIAAFDSALQLRLVTRARLRGAVSRMGVRERGILAEVDGRAQSGLESIVRVVVRDLGLRVRSQVRFAGIGVVDLLVEDWVVVETDGAAFHDAVATPRDRLRDALHAAAGRTPLRFRYAQVVHELPTVTAAIVGAVRAHRRVRNSGRLADKALIRARRSGLA